MKIRTRLYLSSGITLFLMSALLILISRSSISYDGEMKRTSTANKLVQDTTELITLTDEYLTLYNERSEKQWGFKLDLIMKTLEGSMDRKQLHPLVSQLRLLNEYFLRIKTEHNLKRGLLQNNAPRAEIKKIEHSQKMLSDQIHVNTQEIQLTMFKLAKEANWRMQEIQKTTHATTLVFVLILMVVSVINTLVTVNRITEPLNTLIKGVGIIESENFQYQIPEKRPRASFFGTDEVSSLTQAFNHMTQRLRHSFSNLQAEVAEKEKAETALIKSEGLLREVINSMEKAIAIYEPVSDGDDFKFVEMNDFGEKLTHYKIETVIGKTVTELFPGESAIGLIEKLRETYYTGKSTQIPLKQYQDDRLSLWVENYIFKLPSGRVVAMFEDTFEKRQVEEQIKASLKEKETLLREIHHRVKNNMQIIASLLRLQVNRQTDSGIKTILEENIGRVYAMSAIHESLHQSHRLSEIDLKSYITKLSQLLLQTISIDPSKVAFKIESPEFKLNIDKANPLGLVMNELISNSLKYAFPGGEKGEIHIRFRELMDNMVELIIMDNGIGMPTGFDWERAESLGLRLVRNLVENQLDGTIAMTSESGTRFTIHFNVAS
ncbi:HAMP domain-containing protein [bacterium]|nr:HAMP domain-containing protein [bacterium]